VATRGRGEKREGGGAFKRVGGGGGGGGGGRGGGGGGGGGGAISAPLKQDVLGVGISNRLILISCYFM
jgi:hypothetical protein